MTKEIEKFFKALRPGNEREAFETFGKNAKSILERYFGGKGEAIELMKTAFTTITTVFGNLKLIMAERILDGASTGLENLADYLEKGIDKNGEFSFDKIGETGGGALLAGIESRFGKEGGRLFTTLTEKFLPALDRAAPLIGKVVLKLFEKFREFAASHADVIIKGAAETMKLVFSLKVGIFKYLITEEPLIAAGMAALVFGPSLAGAAIGALAASAACGHSCSNLRQHRLSRHVLRYYRSWRN